MSRKEPRIIPSPSLAGALHDNEVRLQRRKLLVQQREEMIMLGLNGSVNSNSNPSFGSSNSPSLNGSYNANDGSFAVNSNDINKTTTTTTNSPKPYEYGKYSHSSRKNRLGAISFGGEEGGDGGFGGSTNEDDDDVEAAQKKAEDDRTKKQDGALNKHDEKQQGKQQGSASASSTATAIRREGGGVLPDLMQVSSEVVRKNRHVTILDVSRAMARQQSDRVARSMVQYQNGVLLTQRRDIQERQESLKRLVDDEEIVSFVEGLSPGQKKKNLVDYFEDNTDVGSAYERMDKLIAVEDDDGEQLASILLEQQRREQQQQQHQDKQHEDAVLQRRGSSLSATQDSSSSPTRRRDSRGSSSRSRRASSPSSVAETSSSRGGSGGGSSVDRHHENYDDHDSGGDATKRRQRRGSSSAGQQQHHHHHYRHHSQHQPQYVSLASITHALQQVRVEEEHTRHLLIRDEHVTCRCVIEKYRAFHVMCVQPLLEAERAATSAEKQLAACEEELEEKLRVGTHAVEVDDYKDQKLFGDLTPAAALWRGGGGGGGGGAMINNTKAAVAGAGVRRQQQNLLHASASFSSSSSQRASSFQRHNNNNNSHTDDHPLLGNTLAYDDSNVSNRAGSSFSGAEWVQESTSGADYYYGGDGGAVFGARVVDSFRKTPSMATSGGGGSFRKELSAASGAGTGADDLHSPLSLHSNQQRQQQQQQQHRHHRHQQQAFIQSSGASGGGAGVFEITPAAASILSSLGEQMDKLRAEEQELAAQQRLAANAELRKTDSVASALAMARANMKGGGGGAKKTTLGGGASASASASGGATPMPESLISDAATAAPYCGITGTPASLDIHNAASASASAAPMTPGAASSSLQLTTTGSHFDERMASALNVAKIQQLALAFSKYPVIAVASPESYVKYRHFVGEYFADQLRQKREAEERERASRHARNKGETLAQSLARQKRELAAAKKDEEESICSNIKKDKKYSNGGGDVGDNNTEEVALGTTCTATPGENALFTEIDAPVIQASKRWQECFLKTLPANAAGDEIRRFGEMVRTASTMRRGQNEKVTTGGKKTQNDDDDDYYYYHMQQSPHAAGTADSGGGSTSGAQQQQQPRALGATSADLLKRQETVFPKIIGSDPSAPTGRVRDIFYPRFVAFETFEEREARETDLKKTQSKLSELCVSSREARKEAAVHRKNVVECIVSQSHLF